MNQEELKKIVEYDPDTGIFTRDGRILGTKTAQGYLTATIKSKPYLLHRLAFIFMNDKLPKGQCDHVNGTRTDNRWCNLREVTCQQNMFNKRSNLNREENMKNVYWIPKLNRYRVKVKVNGETRHYGYFDKLEDAIHQAKEVQKVLHGFYARGV
jgi:hypothetical protein